MIGGPYVVISSFHTYGQKSAGARCVPSLFGRHLLVVVGVCDGDLVGVDVVTSVDKRVVV